MDSTPQQTNPCFKHRLLACNCHRQSRGPPLSTPVYSPTRLCRPRRKIVVIGGGYIGVEMACVFKGYGSEAHYCFRGDYPLKGFDMECRKFLTQQIEDVHGLILHRNSQPTEVTKQPDGRLTYKHRLADGTEETIADVDQVLVATGRKPNVANLGLEELGINQDPKVTGGGRGGKGREGVGEIGMPGGVWSSANGTSSRGREKDIGE